MYLFRQGMELGIKALICGAITNKGKIQQVFLSCKHDLYKLFEAYEAEAFLAITGEEYNWLKKYLESLEMVDAKSDLFRFPLEDEFLQFANHGIGNCYLWESITGDGFHKLVLGYGQTAEFLFMECTGISKDEKIFPILFFIEKSYRIGTEENVL